MPVTSKELTPAAKAVRPTAALLDQARLSRQQPIFERLVAVALWLISLAGTLLWAGGGWADWAAFPPNWIGVAVGLTGQLVVSYVQYIYADRLLSWQYLAALAVSAAGTVAGYVPLVGASLQAAVLERGAAAELAPLFALLLVLVPAVVMDVLPERILIRRR